MYNTYAIGDIHGGLKALQEVIAKSPLKPNDRLIFLGDYCDGWSETPALIDYLLSLKDTYQCIFIMGNHDELVCKWLKTGEYNSMWKQHGGRSTIEAYKTVEEDTKRAHIDFLENLLPYYIDQDNRLFLHAGFTNPKGVAHEYFKEVFWWDRTLWELALCLSDDYHQLPHTPQRLQLYHEIFIGHTPTTRLGTDQPLHKANVWNIDTGAAFKGRLTLINVATKDYWQSSPLPQLYPNEKGRN